VVKIYTYNDLTDIGQNEQKRMEFVLSAIREHKGSELYKTAYDAELYYKHQNPTIMRYQKFVYNQFGQKVPDVWSPNNKIASNWYNYFTTQAVSYLLGNGVTFGKKEATKDKLGKDFDKMVQDIATHAKNGGVAFGFWNLDHLECFDLTELVPLYDEDDGGLKAGIRFWQIDNDKPLRATLYELDGYTDYIKRKDKDVEVLVEKRKYTETKVSNAVEGDIILDGENYPGFPIVPLWNVNRQSDLVGNRGTIDAYDLMVSGLINNVSSGEFLYWVLTNCDGMSDADVAKFIEQLTVTHFAKMDNTDEGSKAEAHKAEVPFEASAEAIDRLERQLFKDFMALKVDDIAAGATNDQIQAAYEPINQKTDKFEYQVTDFIQGILELAGIEDEPTYTRSQMSNQRETLEMVLQCAEYLDDEYITTKLLTLLGDADKVDEVLKRKDAEAADRYKPQEAELEELRKQQNNEPMEVTEE
jgi:SPP1 family phage portal protein